MLPIQKHPTSFRTLDDIRQRKEQLYDDLQKDNAKFGKLWGQLFVKQESSTRSEFISGLIANSITIIDIFLLARKLRKNYGNLFGFGKKKK